MGSGRCGNAAQQPFIPVPLVVTVALFHVKQNSGLQGAESAYTRLRRATRGDECAKSTHIT